MRISIAAALVCAALVAGCGSTDTGVEGGGDDSGRQANDQEVQLAYENGYQQCTGFPLKDLQATTAEPATMDSGGAAVGRATPGQPVRAAPTKQGCIDAIEGKPLKQAGGFDPQGETNTTP